MGLERGILDDLSYVDGQETWRLTHLYQGVANTSAGTWGSQKQISDIAGCVRRAIADREVSSTRQVQQRMESIQKDLINVSDLVLEVPNGHEIRVDDTIQQLDEDKAEIGPRYTVVSIDKCTFRSRKRLGCRQII